MKRAVVAGAVVVVAILLLLWKHGSSTDGEHDDRVATAHTAGGESSRGASAATKPPTWFGFQGLAGKRIAGVVTFEAKPVHGAVVSLHSLLTDLAGAAVETRKTGADGRFDFGEQLAANYTVVADAEGMAAAIVRVDLSDPIAKPASDHLVLRLSGCEVSVAGTIFDASGGPIAGARVRRERVIGVDTDATGAYKLCLRYGSSELEYSADGYGAVILTLEARGAMKQDLVLVPEASITVHAVRADNGKPVADAQVWVGPQDWGPDRARGAEALTDGAGKARISGLVPGRYHVWANAPGLVAREPAGVLAELGAPAEVMVRMIGAARIRGVIMSDKATVVGAHVSAIRKSPMGRSRESISQADGSFVLDNVPLGDLVFAAGPYEVKSPAHFLVEHARDYDHVVIDASRLGSIQGRVTRLGQPVAGAQMCCIRSIASFNTAAFSDADGHYEYKGVQPGAYELTAQSEEAGAFTLPKKLALAAGEDRTFDLELELAGTIEGVVVDQQGHPVPGVFVRWIFEKTGDLGRSITDANGRYRCGAMTGGGVYRASVYPTAGMQKPFPTADGSPYPAVEVKDGASVIRDVKIAIELQQLTISGHVVDSAGQPVTDAHVEALAAKDGVTPQFNPWMKLPATFTDKDGGFTLTGLTSGTYALQARSGDGAETTVPNIAAGASNAVITLERAGSIEGKLVGFPSAPVIYARVIGVVKLTPGLVDGETFRIPGLRPGRYIIDAQTTYEGDAQIVEIKAGETAHLVMTAHGRGAIDVALVEFRTRKPVQGASCHAVMAAGGEQGVTNWDPTTTARPDAAGHVTIDPAPAGNVTVSCQMDSFRLSMPATDVMVTPGAHLSAQLLTVEMMQNDAVGTIGVELSWNITAPRITGVVGGSSGAKAGLAVGDLIVAVDGTSVEGLDGPGVNTLIVDRPLGAKVAITVLRGVVRKTVTAELVPFPM
ncbi:MAG: hypothetical protein JWO36_7487 [Myxococcales bacterium]|nr:hypothetical protein [Myxococcales bacterium]